MPALQESGISLKKGFTLIELMVSIAIIAILAAVGLVVYSTAQKSARISRRVQDFKAIGTSLELFRVSTGAYPAPADPGQWYCIEQLTGSAKLSPEYMPVVPKDPTGTHCYSYRSDGTDYKVRTQVGVYNTDMTSNDFKQQPGLIDPFRDNTADCIVDQSSTAIQAWAIYTRGACGW